ncbi:unnamed protein product [Arabis nemorensis]|uniref:DUF674 family protein n=1 Tax=Arabis nemorensis TaxID=586526 RepID=A0A565B5T1_9BRAS|nr:unnamed protein product [Arabis nemorensis]
MAETSEMVKLSLRLLIDEEKNKVVLTETGKDFVEVLFSFLTLPMGTIVRLLEKHRKSPQVVVGCFNNLYQSVSEMGLESFQTESCKRMLLYPTSVNHDKYQKIKLKIDDTPRQSSTLFVQVLNLASYYSISNTEECVCGEFENSSIIRGLTNREIYGIEEEQVEGRILRNSSNDGVFVSRETCFIITEDLKVSSSSMDNVLNTLRGLGYTNAYKLGEIHLDVGLNEVLTLLECVFTLDSPLTDTFLRKRSSLRMTRTCIPLSPTVQESGAGPDQSIKLKAFVRKLDGKILCVECGADFIDLLLTFLVLPLESAWKFCGDSISLGCIGNLFRSFFKSLNERTDATSSKCLLPSFYSCPKQLLDVVTEQEEIYYSFNRCSDGETYDSKFTRKMPGCLKSQRENKNMNMYLGYKKADAEVLYMRSFGFVRDYARFLVTDDLVIKPKKSVSNISLLKLQMHLEEKDVEEQVITRGYYFTKSFNGDILCFNYLFMELDCKKGQRRNLREEKN